MSSPALEIMGDGPDLTADAPRHHYALAGRLIVACGFLLAATVYALGSGGAAAPMLALAAGFGGYMALNIGANDVANNIGPAVGARVIPLGAALTMAAVCEAAGAFIAGGEVVGTIRSGIIAPSLIGSTDTYVWAMLAALLAAALWLNLATAFGAPVSTTHAIVGGVLGAGVAAAGTGIVHWGVMGEIVASWIISPLMGAGLAAGCLYLVKRSITWQPDLIVAARRGVPLLAGGMTAVFVAYLALKGLARVIALPPSVALLAGLIAGLVAWGLMRAHIARHAAGLERSKAGVNSLLGVPLVLAAGALSFAHGSNDVANAIGPLAGVVDALQSGDFHAAAPVPAWVMALGAIGLAIGLLTFGPRVIRTVGGELTSLDALRACCIALSATVTVIIASQLGLPVSTTHVTVGALLGVGYLRAALKARHAATLSEIRALHPKGEHAAAEAFIARFHAAPFGARKAMLADLKELNLVGAQALDRPACKALARAHKRDIVNRRLMLRIAAAWVVTVPASAVMGALLFFTLRGMFLS